MTSVLALFSCQKKPEKITPRFVPSQVQEILINHFDPSSRDPQLDRWNARLLRNPPSLSGTSASASGGWKVASGPDGTPPVDRIADASVIEHLLDGILEVRAQSPSPHGPLNSLGLDPPKFAIRLTLANNKPSFEIKVGGTVSGGATHFISPDHETPQLGRGVLFPLLERISGFKDLRESTLMNFALDNVLEVEAHSNRSSKTLYAQRDGDQWADRRHHSFLKSAWLDFLNQAGEARITSFIDDPVESPRLYQEIFGSSDYRVKLTDMRGQSTLLLFKHQRNAKGEHWFATISTRPSATFEVDKRIPTLLQKAFDPIAR